jgi:hypothetical protein
VIAAILLAAVFLRHHSTFTLAEMTGWTASGIFYVEGALLEVVLLSVLALFILRSRRSLDRALALLACGIGIIEGAMVAGCRMLSPGQPPRGVTQCDWLTGQPVAATAIVLSVLAMLAVCGYWWRYVR